MVVLPGWVPLRDGLPQFDVLDPIVVQVPEGATLRAWPKLRELERRWLYFEWFSHAVARTPEGNRSLLDDAASAYLMTFEAAFQVIGDQLFAGNSKGLRDWLDSHRPDDYDLVCRGLRTLRHVEAHVHPGNLQVVGDQLGNSVFSGSSWGQTLPWCFAQLSESRMPRSPALDLPEEMAEWNALTETTLVASLMRHGVQRAFGLAELAEEKAGEELEGT